MFCIFNNNTSANLKILSKCVLFKLFFCIYLNTYLTGIYDFVGIHVNLEGKFQVKIKKCLWK